MYFEQNRYGVQSDLDYSIDRRFHQKKILAFLRTNLPKFAGDFIGTSPISAIRTFAEDYISTEISLFLNNKSNETGYIFIFQATGPDILVHQFPHAVHTPELFVIEAKRLPPTSSRDYVKTGIRRFKTEEHGKPHELAAILGYIQDKDSSYWHKIVNSWIDTLISNADETPKWIEQDKLIRIKVTDLAEYESKHSRVSKDPIILHHLWIMLNKIKAN
jgi:hypothetical protein